jgi:hypothetical protein
VEEGHSIFEYYSDREEPPSSYTLAVHRLLTTPLFFTPLAQNTATVFVQERDPLVRRALIAELIARLAEARAAAVLIDFVFSPGEVLDQHPNTQRLRDAVREWSGKVPIIPVCNDVSGSSSTLPDEKREELERGHAVAIEPTLLFTGMDGGSIPCALGSFDMDPRRIPLAFPVREASLESMPTLSFRAATLRVANLRERVRGLTFDELHPFANFLTRDQLTTLTAEDVLKLPTDVLTQRITGRLVFLGADEASDRHATPVGELPGVLLHANYTEALLDNRIYFGSSWVVVFLVNLVVLTGLDIVCERFPLWKAITILATFLFAWFVITKLSVFVLHYYLPISLPTYPFIVLKWLRLEQRIHVDSN